MRIVIGSYNIHRSFGRDMTCDPERIVAVINALKADVVALQEVESPSASGHNLLRYFADQTGLEVIPGPIFLGEHGHYGNALLTSAEVLAVRRFDLAHPGREPRSAIDVDLRCRDVTFRVVATHLGLLPGERRYQVKRLLQLFDPADRTPTALIGDFNEWFPRSRPLRWIVSYFGRAPAPATFPAHFPLLALDRIWVRPDRALRRLELFQSRLAAEASDHLPLRAEIEW